MSSDRLLIRADASAFMGAGHVMRSLALAQAWSKARGEVTFFTAIESSSLESRLRLEGMDVQSLQGPAGGVEDATQTINMSRKLDCDWIIVDGYQFDSAYQEALRQSGLRVLVIDDHCHARRYVADFVLNHNHHANATLYPVLGEGTRLLLGTRYVLIRQEFLDERERRREQPQCARRVLVTLGGGDASNTTLKVVEALIEIDRGDLEVKVVCGHLNEHRESLRRKAEAASFSIDVLSATREIPALMAWADVAISAGGSTCWELAFMGLPAIAIVLADNQIDIVESLDRLGVVKSLGSHENINVDMIVRRVSELLDDHERRAAMSRRAGALVDGQGAARVVSQLLS